MNIIFRADASIRIGLGHIMRCLVLAKEFQSQQNTVTFICKNLTGNAISLIQKNLHSILVLPTVSDFFSDNFYIDCLGSTQEIDAEQTIHVIPPNADLLIVDQYALDAIWHHMLRPYAKKIMVLDDLANKNFECDILLNQNLGSSQEQYENKIPNACQMLLGCKYALLRPEFADTRQEALLKRDKTQHIRNILISVGGSDIDNVTYKILQSLNDDFNIVVLLGKHSPYNQMIEQYADKNNIKVIIDGSNMANLMLYADLAIGAAGSTSWERCCLGLPTLLWVTADNQIEVAKSLEKAGASKIIRNLPKDLQTLKNNFDLWKYLSHNARTICDGLGAQRVINSVA
mgnify:CR=1 FL=1